MVVYNKEYWRCTDRTCKGKLHLSGGRIVYVKKNGHNHGPDHKGASADQALMTMRKRVHNNPATPFQQLYEETVSEMEALGHGPLRQLLPYADCCWKVLGQEQGTSGARPGGAEGRGSAGSVRSKDQASRNHCAGAPAESNSRPDAVDEVLVESEADEPKSEVCELEVIDCTDMTAEASLASPVSTSVTIATGSLNKMIPASHSTLARSGRAHSSHLPVQSDIGRAGTTTVTPGGSQVGPSTAQGLKIHSTYSLQPLSVQANLTTNQDTSQGIVGTPVSNIDLNQHTTDNVFEALTEDSGQNTVNHPRATYVKTAPSSASLLQVNSNISKVLVTQHTVPNHNAVQSVRSTSAHNQGSRLLRQQGGGIIRNTTPRVTAARMPNRAAALLDRPVSVHSPAEPTLPPTDPQPQAYTQLQMRLARKEHQLRLQHMKERHNAEMVLVHLQQELVREQLRELRQPAGGLNS
ncbi:uncharacterized protein LOC110980750 isoform X2 [Acanthaster planci]|nr:uncharacterized protein LOC110980750 isoform X2 [Acanthaster planci]XP_022093390.1 uncharacterized protein LOC110980750 isoform X2 [Acanthaster planci]